VGGPQVILTSSRSSRIVISFRSFIEQEVLLIAGGSGSGKTSVSCEVSDQLQAADVARCLVDGNKPGHCISEASRRPSWHRTHRTSALTRTVLGLWQTNHGDGGVGVGGGAVPQLTVEVVSPAFDGSAGGHRAGVVAPG
jgi:hypothetical protein